MTDTNRSNWWSWRDHVVGTRCLCSSSLPSSDAGEGVDADDLPSLREYIATLGVFFTLPEQGVTSPEILTRFDSCQVTRPRLWHCALVTVCVRVLCRTGSALTHAVVCPKGVATSREHLVQQMWRYR